MHLTNYVTYIDVSERLYGTHKCFPVRTRCDCDAASGEGGQYRLCNEGKVVMSENVSGRNGGKGKARERRCRIADMFAGKKIIRKERKERKGGRYGACNV